MPTASSRELDRLIDCKSKLVVEMEALRNKIEGLDLAISLLSDVHPPSPGSSRASGVTGALIEMLEETGEDGLNAQTAMEMALQRGLHLRRLSLSSLLSRLKRQGIVVYEDGRYRLVKRAEAPESAEIEERGRAA